MTASNIRRARTYDAPSCGDTTRRGRSQLAVVPGAAPAARDSGIDICAAASRADSKDANALAFTKITALCEALRDARDATAALAAVERWARLEVDAVEMRVDAPASGDEVDEEGPPSARSVDQITVPIGNAEVGSITFTVDGPACRDDVTSGHLFALAGAIIAAALTRLRIEPDAPGDGPQEQPPAARNACNPRGFGDSPRADHIARMLPRLATSDATVMILGESGSGKTFLARLIHEAGPRAKEPLRVINCAAIPETLIESELFGHERGAFTGAVAARAGVLQDAGRGTVLLDEIGELPPASQAKLLRVLEERRFERVGSNKSIPLQARLLVATNRDLVKMVEAGTFRGDLFYRVSVVRVEVPPLRDRGDDLIQLARQMLREVAGAGRKVTGFTDDAIAAISAYSWPGNVRELRNAIEAAVVLGEGERIRADDLPANVTGEVNVANDDPFTVRLPARLDWLEERAVDAAMRSTGGNRTRAAAVLGVCRVTLYNKLKG